MRRCAVPQRRDPSQDGRARYALLLAIRAWQDRRGAASVFVSWVPGDRPGAGGVFKQSTGRRVRLTHKERILTRAMYHQASDAPKQRGEDPTWSVKLDWGQIERHGHRYGRVLTVRVFEYASGQRFSRRQPGGQWMLGDGRSSPGARIDG